MIDVQNFNKISRLNHLSYLRSKWLKYFSLVRFNYARRRVRSFKTLVTNFHILPLYALLLIRRFKILLCLRKT